MSMAPFIWKSLYLIIGTISYLLIVPLTASPQFDKDFTLPALGDSPIQQVATPLNPAPDPIPDDAQWTSQAQLPDLLPQPQSLDDLDDDDTFDPSLIALSPTDTQPPAPKSSPASGSCAAKAKLKPGASRLLRRAYEMQPCCDPVNLGLENPFNWLFGQASVENRYPYCCKGGGIEYARTRLCVPWQKGHEWCKDPDNWSCCIYGGPIFNGQVHATHCWSVYPPPVKVPEPANQ